MKIKMKNKKVSFVFLERTPYHDVLISNLNKNTMIDLRVYYIRQKSQKRPWDFDYGETSIKLYYCHTYRKYFNNFIKGLINDKPDLVIITGYYHPKLFLSHLFMKLFNVRFAEWADVPRLDIPRPRFKKFLRSTFLKWIYSNAQAVLVMGQPGIEASKMEGCQEYKLRNFPCAVDLEIPTQIDQGIREKADSLKRRLAPEGEIIFLSAGRLAPEKGHEWTLQAFGRVLSKCPRKKGVLLFAGDGPRRLALQELAARLKISNQVHFLGWCQSEDMKALFYLSDILINPSLWENFGVAILEAMAWGMPVLASNRTKAALDRIRHGENGFIHEVGDVAALADHMMYFLNDPGQITIMGERARKTAEQWPASRYVQTVLDLVE
jgi:glycosyltransferase involved in cell wall biosynthesis